jgi:NAD(P)-dependent dehydrogenase (short-subunit alcohol dehydrogenase family)
MRFPQVSKAMLNRATQLLAAHPAFTTRGVRVTAVDPGWVRTDMGGSQAFLGVEEGAARILALVNQPPGTAPSGLFYVDGVPAPW